MNEISLLPLITTLFLVANPIGNSPGIIALIKDFSTREQQWILLKESIIAMLLALFFQFFGEYFLDLLQVKEYTVRLCGGILLFVVSLDMILPRHISDEMKVLKEPPFIVPIATPLISGPGVMTMIMLLSHEIANQWILFTAILITWSIIALVLVMAPWVQRVLKRRGMLALERLMGLLLSMMGVEMLQKGSPFFSKMDPKEVV